MAFYTVTHGYVLTSVPKIISHVQASYLVKCKL